MASEKADTTSEEEQSTPILPLLLFSVSPPPPSPESSGTLTPPLHSAAAAVPFRWEEEPGKPKPSPPSTAIVAAAFDSSAKSELQLPPSLMVLEIHGSNRFRSPSLRFVGTDCVVDLVSERRSGWFSRWRKMVKKKKMKKREGSHVFPSCGHVTSAIEGTDGYSNRLNNKGSRLWAKIRERLKHMVPWSKKQKNKDYI